jgi:REP element-mobilizing transposase RayT
MEREYEYRRHLPHFQGDCAAIFATFSTHHRWILPAAARSIALEACLWGHGKHFSLHGAVVMPDHVHLVLTPLRDDDGPFSVADIMQGIKSSSAHEINRALSRAGQVWQHESFDHVLRQEEGIAAKVEYVIQNPVRKGLARMPSEYRWLWVNV